MTLKCVRGYQEDVFFSNVLLRYSQAEISQAGGADDGDSSRTTTFTYPCQVPWLDESFGFYAIPAEFSLSKSECFRQGRIYGQDVSSGAAVAALLTNMYDEADGRRKDDQHMVARVLDLCCAPGLKLCAIADWLNENMGDESLVVGVDNSETRLATTKKIVCKYHIDSETSQETPSDETSKKSCRFQLYCNDGTLFGGNEGEELNLVFDSSVAKEDQKGKRKRMNKSARARERKRLKQIGTEVVFCSKDEGECQLFDAVLVDAECSTDGSIKHVQQRLSKCKDQSTIIPQLTDKEKLSSLVDLQKRLAASGFRLLKKGGSMVYSTCSLSDDQNENVVKWLLQQFSNAELVPLSFTAGAAKVAAATDGRVVVGSLPGTVRFLPFSPSSSNGLGDARFFGEGFFLAKIRKA